MYSSMKLPTAMHCWVWELVLGESHSVERIGEIV
ncbi:hypothetical protein A2U01_0043502, partial [Trifolium medium]|nr:hypothetical protein [Trifolium medium]